MKKDWQDLGFIGAMVLLILAFLFSLSSWVMTSGYDNKIDNLQGGQRLIVQALLNNGSLVKLKDGRIVIPPGPMPKKPAPQVKGKKNGK